MFLEPESDHTSSDATHLSAGAERSTSGREYTFAQHATPEGRQIFFLHFFVKCGNIVAFRATSLFVGLSAMLFGENTRNKCTLYHERRDRQA